MTFAAAVALLGFGAVLISKHLPFRYTGRTIQLAGREVTIREALAIGGVIAIACGLLLSMFPR